MFRLLGELPEFGSRGFGEDALTPGVFDASQVGAVDAKSALRHRGRDGGDVLTDGRRGRRCGLEKLFGGEPQTFKEQSRRFDFGCRCHDALRDIC
ncbi:hypothetical protein [Nocardia tenerifensis]|uniref:hypothetical protein n=1 Tax=Nocardia tenerifensis TaxID=228006 RepID=UPI000593E6E0|nr:hypothetical protein [Nocardia tenerifensis]